jgi:hypothetical protein
MHQYPMHTRERTTAEGIDIRWQDGPIGAQLNGATVEGVIRSALAKMHEYQEERPCDFNRRVMEHLIAALGELDARTADRHRRGVLGTERV